MTLNYFQSRRQHGKMNEEFYKPIIEKDINTTLQSNNKFNLFDFENLNFKVELKTREVERMKYKTTIVGYDKIEKGLEFIKEGKRVIFYFGFKNDGLFKFELKEDNYLNLKISNVGCRWRKASGKEKLHIDIPVELLEFVSNETPIQGAYTKKLKELKQ